MAKYVQIAIVDLIESIFLQAFGQKKKFLELRFRPEDDYSHPIFGDYTVTSNLLLKVTRKKKSATQQPQQPQQEGKESFHTEMVGRVVASYQFKGMADFQYLPPISYINNKAKREAAQSPEGKGNTIFSYCTT